MKTFITTLLLGAFAVSYGQECSLLMPDNVKVMGLERASVNLDDIDPVTLPVVFHIVHKGEGDVTNISDEQVLSQMPALDTGFRWGPGVDTKIQFCLASRDPDGNPTSGITRHNGVQLFGDLYDEEGVTSSSFFDGVNDNSLKSAVGCWNPDEYINIYVVSEIQGNNGGGGIQGYAYLGPTGDCRDGIVQLYNVTGTEGVLKPGRTLGKTAVHEMGHYLSLFHTFSNSFGCTETNCETQGDMVCDTPPTLSNQGCSTSGGCEDAMIENFMDYTSETCKYTFTLGQAERMHSMLQTSRQGLVESYACLNPVDYDVAVTSAFYNEQWCTDYQDIWVTVTNQGNEPTPFAEVVLTCGGVQHTEELYDLSDGAGVAVLFSDVLVAGADGFEVELISELDEYPDNDTGYWPLDYQEGDLLTIDVHKDFWGCLGWQFLDGDGEIVVEDYYNAGEATYTYEVCVYEGCYTIAAQDCAGDGFCTIDFDDDGVCDIGSEGIVGRIGQDTVFATGWGLQFYEWEQEWCIYPEPVCPMDYDGDGTIGTNDIIIMFGEYGCVGNCDYDPDGDGIVGVMDLLMMLASVGDCPSVSGDFLSNTTEAVREQPLGVPIVFDVTGRVVTDPIDQLPTGIYILKYDNLIKKIFIQ